MNDALFEIEGYEFKPNQPKKVLRVRKPRKREGVCDSEPIPLGDELTRRGQILAMIKHVGEYSTANYIGNKRELAEQIPVILDKYNVHYDSVFDAFSGSGIVSLIFKLLNKKVTCNDLLTSSALQAECLLNLDPTLLTKADWMFLLQNKTSPKNFPSITSIYDNWAQLFTKDEVEFLDNFRANLIARFGKFFQVGNKTNVTSNILSLDGSLIGLSEIDQRIALALYALIMHMNSHCFVGGRYYNGQTLAKLEHRLAHQQNDGLQFFENLYDNSAHRVQFPLALRDMERTRVYNSDIIELLDSKSIQADLIYLDPPYGGDASDYVYKYQMIEEYLHGSKLSNSTLFGGSRFDKKKGFAEEFSQLLERCGNFPSWLISFNATSFAKLEDICAIIKKFRQNVVVEDTAKLYKYRKERAIATDKEFLILARE